MNFKLNIFVTGWFFLFVVLVFGFLFFFLLLLTNFGSFLKTFAMLEFGRSGVFPFQGTAFMLQKAGRGSYSMQVLSKVGQFGRTQHGIRLLFLVLLK